MTEMNEILPDDIRSSIKAAIMDVGLDQVIKDIGLDEVIKAVGIDEVEAALAKAKADKKKT